MKRKVVIVFLVFALLCAMLPTVFAADYTSGDYTYTLDTDGNASIKKYTGSTAELTIPDTLDGHLVVEIEDEAFETDDEGEVSVVIMKIEQDDEGNDCYVCVEDEALQEVLFEKFLKLMDEQEEEQE